MQVPGSLISPGMPARVGHRDRLRMIDAIKRCGLTSGLQLCLDAGDVASYPGSGQEWLDASGVSASFYLGTTSGATATDPTFTGVAGARSRGEYFAHDGGDLFQYSTANPTWIENLHKDNASFTLMMWVYFGSIGGVSQGLFGTSASANTGVSWAVTTAGLPSMFITNAGATVLNQSSATAVSATTWTCIGLSLNEATGAGGIQWFMNGIRDTDTSTYSSPSSGSATYAANIAARGNSSNPLLTGSRVAAFLAWEGVALTATQMQMLFLATRTRFGV